LVEDHRGESGYVGGKSFTIKELGPYPDGWSTTPPEKTADELKAEAEAACLGALAEIDAKSTRSIRAIEVLRAELAVASGSDLTALNAKLTDELTFLEGLESQARAQRAALAEIRG
jgi:hypothetical protein